MSRRSFFEGLVFLYIVVVAVGAFLIGYGYGGLLRAPWATDETGIALVARRDLRRNEIVRRPDLAPPNAVPVLLRRFAAPLPDGKYLVARHSKGDLVLIRELLDQPRYAIRNGHSYRKLSIDDVTAAMLRPADTVELRWSTGKRSYKFSSCVEAVLMKPSASVVYAVRNDDASTLPANFTQVVFYMGGRRCQ